MILPETYVAKRVHKSLGHTVSVITVLCPMLLVLKIIVSAKRLFRVPTTLAAGSNKDIRSRISHLYLEFCVTRITK